MYLRAAPALLSDLEDWASALSALAERSQLALRYLLAFLTSDVRVTQTASKSFFDCEEDCLCLADENDYLVVNYLSRNEHVSNPHSWGHPLSIMALLMPLWKSNKHSVTLKRLSSMQWCAYVVVRFEGEQCGHILTLCSCRKAWQRWKSNVLV